MIDEWVIFVSQVVAMGGGGGGETPSELFGELCKEV